MEFVVSRTSDRCSDERKPCDEAIKSFLNKVDMWIYASPEEFNRERASKEGEWFAKGTNHRIINGRIARNIGKEDCWVIKISSISQLIAFQQKYGEFVITTSCIDYKTPEIKIYDDYKK